MKISVGPGKKKPKLDKGVTKVTFNSPSGRDSDNVTYTKKQYEKGK